ncbi:MAG: hypothetical protein IH599_01230 [Bacteroidales bacterium]|nr:hypothetical protein [Bacteroidales bacterium]
MMNTLTVSGCAYLFPLLLPEDDPGDLDDPEDLGVLVDDPELPEEREGV